MQRKNDINHSNFDSNSDSVFTNSELLTTVYA